MFRDFLGNRSKAINHRNLVPENDLTTVPSTEMMRKRIVRLKRRIERLEEDIDDISAEEDLRALREAKEEHRLGKTVRLD